VFGGMDSESHDAHAASHNYVNVSAYRLSRSSAKLGRLARRKKHRVNSTAGPCAFILKRPFGAKHPGSFTRSRH
jgi:hypothetical protein